MNTQLVVTQSYNIRQEIAPKFWQLAKSMGFQARLESIKNDLNQIKNQLQQTLSDSVKT